MFEYEKTPFKEDERAKFANSICQLLIDKYKGDYEKAARNSAEIRLYFENHVRNIYELVDGTIPLFGLAELQREETDKGKGNWDFTEKEYDDAVIRTKKACEMYYNLLNKEDIENFREEFKEYYKKGTSQFKRNQ